MRRAPARRAGAWAGPVLWAAAAARLGAAGIDAHRMLQEAVLAPPAAAAAAAARWPVAGLELRPAGAAPGPGDQAVALVSVVAPSTRPAQWLLRVRMADPGGPPAPGPGRDATLYTSVGDAFVFHAAAAASMDLDILGPVVADAPYGAHRHRVAASPDFLMLDLGRAADAMRHIHEAAHTVPGTNHAFGASTQPFPPAVVAANQRYLAPFHLTAEERRSFAGSIPALTEFLNLVQGTPGLADILLQVLEKPSLLDMVRHGGRPDFQFTFRQAVPVALDAPGWGPGGPPPGHRLVIELNLFGKPVLTVVLVVAPPRPPLEVTAGIVGAVAFGPDHPEKAVVVRVLSTRFGPAS